MMSSRTIAGSGGWSGIAWVATKGTLAADASEADRRAHAVRETMRRVRIVDDPWRLPLVAPRLEAVDGDRAAPMPINGDFAEMAAEAFFVWLRNALAHGDGRSIRPLHKPSRRDERELLTGFRIRPVATDERPKPLTLHLYHDDMRRIGATLADLFCASLSGGERYFEEEVGTAHLIEVIQVA
jgi:hypothetical protein